jgi:Na+(H+)/acetate symporter ActP
MELYTVPDFFAARFGQGPRLRRRWAVVCSFTYVVAQIYGIGLIASRLTGVQFEIGILLGLGGCCCARSWAACAPSPGRRWRSTWCCCWPF